MSGGMVVELQPSIAAVPEAEYRALAAHCAAPAYYDRRFLIAAEREPLIPYEAVHYITVRRDGELQAFMPVYRQSVAAADPFGLLARTASGGFVASESALFSHIMHCSDTRILVRDGSPHLYRAVIERLDALARETGVPQFAINNIADPTLLEQVRARGLEVNASVDRFRMDLSGIADAHDLVAQHLPGDGRHEIRRQRRKIAELGIRVVVEAPPFANLAEIGRLCHETTARRGTPGYLPAAALSRFIAACGDLVRIISVYAGGKRVSVAILLMEPEVLHFWLGGMSYVVDTFSPYTATFDAAFDYAFARGCRWIECGRLNERVKLRFGFRPAPLHFAVHRSAQSARAPARVGEREAAALPS